jgi:predicted ATP-dependent protease
LAPVDNCDDISHVPDGLQVIPVATLKEAVEVLRDSDPSKRPSCQTLR